MISYVFIASVFFNVYLFKGLESMILKLFLSSFFFLFMVEQAKNRMKGNIGIYTMPFSGFSVLLVHLFFSRESRVF